MIRFFAKSRCAHCVTDDKLTKGSVGIEVRFYLEDWDAAPNRVVVFKAGSVKVDVALLSDSCTVPPEVLANPGDMLVIGVYGTDSNGDIVIPTVYADAGRVRLGAAPSGISPTPTTQPLIDQLVAAAEEAERVAQSVRDDADNGVFDGEDGVDGNSIWWTTSGISMIPGSRYVVLLPNLIGPVGTSPAVSDLVVGPAPNTSGSATYLYYIFGVDTTYQQVILKSIGSIKGAQGDPGDDGYSPMVTVADIPGGHRVTITDAESSHVFDVMDGQSAGSGLTEDIKQAMLQIAQKVAYIDDQGQTYYQDLYDALYPTAALVSISAVYTQGGTVYDTDSLDSLKTDLVVTGTYDDSTTATIPSTDYTLSGSLTAGTSTITVTSSGKTTTFTVTVTHSPGVYTVTNTLTGCTNSNSAASVTENASYSGTITASSGYTLTGATVSITMGGTDITSTSYSNGTISIASVTGALVITVTAVAVVLSSISAVYTQSGTVYSNASLNSLKTDLVVTATYSDSSTTTVPSADYTLSGTLTAGTSTITVSYSGKTTTFTVTVTEYVDNSIYNWDFTQSLTDSVASREATLSGSGATRDSTGLHITSAGGWCYLGSITNDNVSIEVDVASMSRQGTKHGRFIMRRVGSITDGTGDGFIYNSSGYWATYWGGWSSSTGITDANYFAGKTVRLSYSKTNGYSKLYVDGQLVFTSTTGTFSAVKGWQIGSSSNSFYNLTITGLRVYAEA